MTSAEVGYPALALIVLGECAGLPIPGETALIVASGTAARGHLSLAVVIAVAALAATAGDTLGYWAGRRGGRRLLLRDGRWADSRHRAVARCDRFFARYGAAAVFVGRWVAGLRYLAAVLAGAAMMPYSRFAVANVLGAFGWASSVALLSATIGAHGAILLAVAAVVWTTGLGAVAVVLRHRSA